MSNRFSSMGIEPDIQKALVDMGFSEPTEVQTRAIPHVLGKKDVIVRSKTGSGKTAVFGIPMLQLTDPERPGPQALVLTPTRELAVQVDKDIQAMASHLPHKTAVVYGQHSMNAEVQALKRNPMLVTGTPGRVYDHISQKNLDTKHIRFLVLDEADRMLDMGFIDQVVRIVKRLPRDRVTLLFSATIPHEIHAICSRYMKDPMIIEIESETMTVDAIEQLYYRTTSREKSSHLERVLQAEQPGSCLVFCNMKHTVDKVQRFLTKRGYRAKSLHGDIPQGQRMQTIEAFKRNDCSVLVATDVAARGIHVDNLSLVVNYDVPQEKDSYIHRIGRTGRTGHTGRAISLVTSEDIMSLYEIEEHTGAMIEERELPKPRPKPRSQPAESTQRKPASAKPKPRPKPKRRSDPKPNGAARQEKPPEKPPAPAATQASSQPEAERPPLFRRVLEILLGR